MTNPQKAKGDRAEREAAALLTELGIPARRKLGAGRQDDTGDLDLPGADATVQVCDWTDTVRALAIKPAAAETQRRNAGTRHAWTMLRRRGGQFLFVLTPEQFRNLWEKGK